MRGIILPLSAVCRANKWRKKDSDAVCALIKSLPRASERVTQLLPANTDQLQSMLAGLHEHVAVYRYKMCSNPQCNKVLRNEMKDAEFCSFCNTPKSSSEQLMYISIIEHLQRIYSCEQLAEAMQWHNKRPQPAPGSLHDIYDQKIWQDRVLQDPNIASDPRNVVLGGSADGIKLNAFDNHSQELWPLVTFIYNPPPAMRCIPGLALLTGLPPVSSKTHAGDLQR